MWEGFEGEGGDVEGKFQTRDRQRIGKTTASLRVDPRKFAISVIFDLKGQHPLSRLEGRRSQTSPVIMSRAAEAAMAASYKSLKEDFVSNLTGGEIGEINYVTAVAPVCFSSPTAGLF
jgi:hypothetical protein